MSNIFEFAENGNFDGVKNLIENSVDVNIQNNEGKTLLHIVCKIN